MNIDELTLGQIKEIQSMVGRSTKQPSDYNFYEIGKAYFIRTVTHHYTGELAGFDRGGGELILKTAAWIASDGRFTLALRKGELDEIEPYPSGTVVSINRDTIIDASEWLHDMPESQK